MTGTAHLDLDPRPLGRGSGVEQCRRHVFADRRSERPAPDLADPHAAGTALDVCAVVTDALASRPRDQRRDPAVRTLRQGLGYCWSVAVAADPRRGLPAFTALADTADPDVAWIVRENRRKNRLARLL